MLVHWEQVMKRFLAQRIMIGEDGSKLKDIVIINKKQTMELLDRTDSVRLVARIVVLLTLIVWIVAICCTMGSDPYSTMSNYAFFIAVSAIALICFWFNGTVDGLYSLKKGPIWIIAPTQAPTQGQASFI
jgi:hypothetical protein